MEAPPRWERPDPLPGPVETERLVLRWYRADDAWALFEAVSPHRAAYVPWLPWGATGHRTIEDTIATIQRFDELRARDEGPDFTMATFDRKTGALLGGTGLHRIAAETAEAEVGYWTHALHRGRGICTEATAALVTAAFGPWGFRRLRLIVYSGNEPSQRIPEKLGIPLEGREREAVWVDGLGFNDRLRYGVLASEWDPVTGRVRGRGVKG